MGVTIAEKQDGYMLDANWSELWGPVQTQTRFC